jgi:uncharacterized membrane protein
MLHDLPVPNNCPMHVPGAKVNVPAGALVTMFALVNVKARAPVFLMLIDCVFVVLMPTLENPIGDGDIENDDTTPVPDSDTVVVVGLALLVITSDPTRTPLPFGLNCTVMVQLALTASANDVPTQVPPVRVKSADAAPLICTLLTFSTAVPVFLIVVVSGVFVPALCVPKDSVPGVMVTAGAPTTRPLPKSDTTSRSSPNSLGAEGDDHRARCVRG